ncbi:MAG: hypothetical protein HKO92_05430 [Flavobacteriaceae bacterium]|nr:hypothetical protein [Bacteroidia bacterium]NNK82543.1 hypothetical protein [Flavobacteriaceae bacterium]
MPRIFNFLLFVVLLSVSLQTNAQQKNISEIKHINYSKNVTKPLTNAELAMINEVYGDQTEEYVLKNSNFLKNIKNILRNRVEIMELKNKDLSSFKTLSSVSLIKAFNKKLLRDNVFNPRTFNPLKYDFNFNSRDLIKYYRVDNTNYLIVIHSQYQ